MPRIMTQTHDSAAAAVATAASATVAASDPGPARPVPRQPAATDQLESLRVTVGQGPSHESSWGTPRQASESVRPDRSRDGPADPSQESELPGPDERHGDAGGGSRPRPRMRTTGDGAACYRPRETSHY